jgi:hypothetical protein
MSPDQHAERPNGVERRNSEDSTYKSQFGEGADVRPSAYHPFPEYESPEFNPDKLSPGPIASQELPSEGET